MTVYFYTLGCKVNQYESQAMSEMLRKVGFKCVDSAAEAQLVVVNSCTVTAESSRKTRQAVRRFKGKNPEAVILLTGCMVQAFPEMAIGIKEADIVLGNTEYDKISSIVTEYFERKERIVHIGKHENKEKYCEIKAESFAEHTRAYMKIEDGCNRFCSYCIIPYARGRVRSRALEDIRIEAGKLAENGYKEIVLVGINLSAYGLDTSFELCDAVEVAAEPEGIKRVRLGSLECDTISDEALDRLAECQKFCPQFHLSLQSGCDKTLREMNRKYDTAFYEDFVGRIRSRFQNPSITTDIMVGFQGETDEDFEQSRAFLEKIGFARTHIFSYSVREGTKAALRTDRVPNAEKQRRSFLMQRAAEKCEREFLQSQVGLVSEVLFEEKVNGYWEGYTENYTRVRVLSNQPLEGEILTVKITAAGDGVCYGELA